MTREILKQSIDFQLNPDSAVPAYLQLVQQVKQALRMGILDIGDKLPTVKEVVAEVAVNPNTVMKAYWQLEHEGLVEGRQGVGTFAVRRPAGPPPAMQLRLARSLERWVQTAREAGLDDEGIESMLRDPVRRPRGDHRMSAQDAPAIHTAGLGRRYGPVWALQDCSVSVPRGPLLAREFEDGTHDLAWTQGVTRIRWLSHTVTWPLAAAGWGAALTALVSWWRGPQNAAGAPVRLATFSFDIQGIEAGIFIVLAAALIALAYRSVLTRDA